MWIAVSIVAAVAAVVGSWVWWMRTHPSPFPYSQGALLDRFPRRALSRARLLEVLAPRAGERVLDLGTGTGYHAIAVAEALGPDGLLDVFDVQQEFLDEVVRRAAEAGLDNVSATRGDGRSLPYQDSCFDAAFMVNVLGEIPGQDAALRELARVLKPGGRLVLGESAWSGDPHFVTLTSLRRHAGRAGLVLARRRGRPLAYLAELRVPS